MKQTHSTVSNYTMFISVWNNCTDPLKHCWDLYNLFKIHHHA